MTLQLSSTQYANTNPQSAILPNCVWSVCILAQVSWLRHHLSSPIPQLLAVNNITTTLNPRYRAVVNGAWTEFVMLIKDVKDKDSGQFECQVSGPKHSSLNKKIQLQVIGRNTEIIEQPEF